MKKPFSISTTDERNTIDILSSVEMLAIRGGDGPGTTPPPPPGGDV